MSYPHQPIETSSVSDDVNNNTADRNTVETNDVVTPYAFGVADSLLGKRLATPFQRGVAQCIDLLLVAILSSLNALFLAIIATMTFYKASHNLANNSQRRMTRSFLRVGGAFMLFWTVLLTVEIATEVNYSNDNTVVHNFNDIDDSPDVTDTPKENVQATASEATTNSYSIVAWVKGFITELGLGFGWAALYYSVFTAWFNGKTPGKRLLNIQVLKLDGSGLSLWESFGRYGGYGAGLATGLLGFMQICWDPNRQAIQDKISETLVISTRL
tara:strand:+ start:667 stop:1479 length:813 start_codon:yes stop_codon:yes gene_type:complete